MAEINNEPTRIIKLPRLSEILTNIPEKLLDEDLSNYIIYNEDNTVKLIQNSKLSKFFNKTIDSSFLVEYLKNKVKRNLADSFMLKTFTDIEEPFPTVSDAGKLNIELKNFFYRPEKVIIDNFVYHTKEGIFSKNLKRFFINENIIKGENFLLEVNEKVLKTSFNNYVEKEDKKILIYTAINETKKLDSLEIKMREYIRKAFFDNYIIGQENDFESTLLLGSIDKEYLIQFANLNTKEELNKEKLEREKIVEIIENAIKKKSLNISISELLGYESDLIYNDYDNLTLSDLKVELASQQDDIKTIEQKLFLEDFGMEIPKFKIKGKDGHIYLQADNESAKIVFPSINIIEEHLTMKDFINPIFNLIDEKLPSIIKYEEEIQIVNKKIRTEGKDLLLYLYKNNIKFKTNDLNEVIENISDEKLYSDKIKLLNISFSKKENSFDIEKSEFIQEQLAKIVELIKETINITRTCGINKRTDHTYDKTIEKYLKSGDNWIFNSIKQYLNEGIEIINTGINIETKLKEQEIKMRQEFGLSSIQLKNIFNKKVEDLIEPLESFNAPKKIINAKELHVLMENEINIKDVLPKPENTKRHIYWDTETTGLFTDKTLLAYNKEGKYITEWEANGIGKNEKGLTIYGYDEHKNEILYRNKQEYQYLLKKELIKPLSISPEQDNFMFVYPRKIIDEVIHFAAVVADIDEKGDIKQLQGVSQRFGTNLHISKFIESLVHITNDDVKDFDLFYKSQNEVINFFKTADIISGYNIGSNTRVGFDKRITELSFNYAYLNNNFPDENDNQPKDIKIYDFNKSPVIDMMQVFKILTTIEVTKLAQKLSNEKQITKGNGTLDHAATTVNDSTKLLRTYHHPIIDATQTFNSGNLLLSWTKSLLKCHDIAKTAQELVNLVNVSHLINRDKLPIFDLNDNTKKALNDVNLEINKLKNKENSFNFTEKQIDKILNKLSCEDVFFLHQNRNLLNSKRLSEIYNNINNLNLRDIFPVKEKPSKIHKPKTDISYLR